MRFRCLAPMINSTVRIIHEQEPEFMELLEPVFNRASSAIRIRARLQACRKSRKIGSGFGRRVPPPNPAR
jgi:hypothetical protein